MNQPSSPLVALLLFLSGCTAALREEVSSAVDAGSDAIVEASAHDAGPLCCQVMKDIEDDPFWRHCRYTCELDAALSFANIPWICNVDSPTTCDDRACVEGSSCRGFNGTGLVVSCDAPRFPRDAGFSFCR